MEIELTETLSDVEAYLSVGETSSAASILFEAVREHPSPEAQIAIGAFMGRYCLALWEAHKFNEAKSVSRTVIEEALRLANSTVEPEYLDLYTTALAETGSSPFPVKRLYRHRNLLRLFATVNDVAAGEVVECGCARGLSALQLALACSQRRAGWQGEGFHVYDSFAGLSDPGDEDAIDPATKDKELLATDMRRGRFAVSLEVVQRNLHRLFPRIELHAGWIPEVFSGEPERAYRFVHIDVDLYQPTIDSLTYFSPRLVEGGVVITDDYNWPGARKAFDDFSRQNSLALHTTETEQAYFVKGRAR